MHEAITLQEKWDVSGGRSSGFDYLTLQLRFMQVSESMGDHDSKIVDAASVD
jgi:hypothetical protein